MVRVRTGGEHLEARVVVVEGVAGERVVPEVEEADGLHHHLDARTNPR